MPCSCGHIACLCTIPCLCAVKCNCKECAKWSINRVCIVCNAPLYHEQLTLNNSSLVCICFLGTSKILQTDHSSLTPLPAPTSGVKDCKTEGTTIKENFQYSNGNTTEITTITTEVVQSNVQEEGALLSPESDQLNGDCNQPFQDYAASTETDQFIGDFNQPSNDYTASTETDQFIDNGNQHFSDYIPSTENVQFVDHNQLDEVYTAPTESVVLVRHEDLIPALADLTQICKGFTGEWLNKLKI